MAATRGICRVCGGEFSKAGMTRHLAQCLAEHEQPAGAGRRKARLQRIFHLFVSGQPASVYWLHLEAPADATLNELDDFLRDIWLECCGHLSAFQIGGVSFTSMDSDWQIEELEDESMDVKLDAVMAVGSSFTHQYDFGSTTRLSLKVLGMRVGQARAKDITLLARNEPPLLPCSECGQPAEHVCTECAWSDTGWLCARCATTHACGEDMFLPVVNSPRVGVCGYTG